MMNVVPRFHWLAFCCLCGCLLISATAWAQDSEADTVEPTEEQAKLNAKAVDAIVDEDYERAVKLLEVSIELGELNVTWLNLGRAYQKLGRCKEAKNAYLSAISAPAVADPSPRLINAKADQYVGELESCKPSSSDGTALAEGDLGAVDDESEPDKSEASDEPADADDQATAATDEPVDEMDDSPAHEPSSSESSNVLAWTLTASGVALMGGGVGLHFWAESVRDEVRNAERDANDTITSMSRQEALDKQTQANHLDTAAVGTLAAGALITGGGLYLLFTSDDVEAAPTASVDASGGVSVGVTGRF